MSSTVATYKILFPLYTVCDVDAVLLLRLAYICPYLVYILYVQLGNTILTMFEIILNFWIIAYTLMHCIRLAKAFRQYAAAASENMHTQILSSMHCQKFLYADLHTHKNYEQENSWLEFILKHRMHSISDKIQFSNDKQSH